MTNDHLTLGFSPCPNDTFMFDALVHKKIDTGGIEVDFLMRDVEDLNRMALNCELDVTKLSFGTYFRIKDNYEILNSGCALGKNCGPLLVSKDSIDIKNLKNLSIAIPGFNTTANLLMEILFPDAKNKSPIPFSLIEDAVISGSYDAGVIIHESRFTYKLKGLIKVADLGEEWSSLTGCLLPLGCIGIKKCLGTEIKNIFDRILKNSIEYAFSFPASSQFFVKENAREMNEWVISKHIQLYVNQFSLDLGGEGRLAIEILEKFFLHSSLNS